MASKQSYFSKWGLLEAAGISEDVLLTILANGTEASELCNKLGAIPTRGILIELRLFANAMASTLQRRPNRVLKLLVETLFPQCKISRADRLERRIKHFHDQLDSLAFEDQEDHLYMEWIPQATGKHNHRGAYVTKEMARHGLLKDHLQSIMSNPSQTEWELESAPSLLFYCDLHDSLKKNRIPMEEIGMIYRAIDPNLRQETTTNKEAYFKIHSLISNYEKPAASGSDNDTSDGDNSYSNQASKDPQCTVHNLVRREKRAKARAKTLQHSLKLSKRKNRANEEKIEQLSAALKETQMILCERNAEITHLKKTIRQLEQTVEVLNIELDDINEHTKEELEKHELDIMELEAQIHHLQEKCQSEVLASTLTTTTSQRHAFTTSVRALYYSLLSMRVPPGQIKSVVKNVISNLLPSVNVDKLHLPGKSCAAYMRSHEMPTISNVHKATNLVQAQQWHLNSDGTTLQQQKKVAFLINGLVCGVQNVHDGSASVALDALKSELAKISETASEIVPEVNSKLDMARIVSSTSDAASTQRKFTHLLEDHTGKEVVENTCSMHLGVNLRKAQVKAVTELAHAKQVEDNSNSRSDSEDEMSDYISENGGGNVSEDEHVMDEEKSKNSSGVYHDIDLFVHEISKLFGHLGTPEYADGESFRVFLTQRASECDGSEREYYTNAQKVVLERQVGSRYYVTSCNAGRIYFLTKAMITFLTEQKMIKSLNRLESTCLKKLQDPLLLSNLQLEGLLFDKIYSDLMMLVKSTDLKKSSLDMNVHYFELLEFLQLLTTKPSFLLDPEKLVFQSEPRIYSNSKKLNHRLASKYLPVRRELYQCEKPAESLLLPMVVAASEAMSSKLQTYKEENLPGGKYFEPNSEVKSILSDLHPHNDKTESVFGANDWLNTVLPNLSQSTRSCMLEFSYNKTMEWLKNQGREQTQTLISLAQARRKIVQEQTKREQQELFKKKIEERKKMLEKARKRELLRQDKVEELKSEVLIASEEELNIRVKNITSLSIPQTLKDAEVKKMVQRQVQLRTTVFKQTGVRINMTEKGKHRALSVILEELKQVIVNNPVRLRRLRQAENHQQLYLIFNKPSILSGVKFKHRFEEEGTLRWYEGHITSYRGGQLFLYYHETDENCQFSVEEIKEDFYSGDFYIM